MRLPKKWSQILQSMARHDHTVEHAHLIVMNSMSSKEEGKIKKQSKRHGGIPVSQMVHLGFLDSLYLSLSLNL